MSDVDQRLLIPITYGFSVRYLLPTGVLDGLATFCRPVVGLGWDDPDLDSLLRARGFEVVRLPEASLTHGYRMSRRRVEVLHRRRLDSVTTRIRRRRQLAMVHPRRDRVLTRLRGWRDSLATLVPGAAAGIEADEARQIHDGTNLAAFRQFIEQTRCDAVVSLTPYHDQDGLLLWAAHELGIPSLTSVISFDNPTTRERLIARSDRIVVWNRHNADELRRSYPDLTDDRLAVIGAPQFDLHRRTEFVRTREAWAASHGLDASRPVVLYGAGPPDLVPHEAGLILLVDQAIEDGRLPGAPQLLVRRHPIAEPDEWTRLGERLRHGTVVHPWAHGPATMRSWPDDDDIAEQMSTLAHGDVHVNVCSSMTLDGAMFDRPQIGPRFAPGANRAQQRRISDLYEQEHWLPIMGSGGLVVVDDAPQLIDALAAALSDPAAGRDGRRRMTREVLTWDDGAAAGRLVESIRALLAADRSALDG